MDKLKTGKANQLYNTPAHSDKEMCYSCEASTAGDISSPKENRTP